MVIIFSIIKNLKYKIASFSFRQKQKLIKVWLSTRLLLYSVPNITTSFGLLAKDKFVLKYLKDFFFLTKNHYYNFNKWSIS